MSPQFVDFNGDGHTDIVAGTFSGSPYVALGNGEGFHQPEMINDRDGERIVLNQFWNYETKKWDSTTRCDPEGGAPASGHGTSAFAVDWDGDGDFDLLLGDYDGGYLYLRENEGKPGEPAFARKNVLVEAGGKPIKVDKMATMRVVDFNGDGTPDLLLGSVADAYINGTGGGVFAFANSSKRLPPKLAAPVTWVAPSRKGASSPTRPDAGLYMDVADHDSDGDLDLIVGGYSMWTPPAPQLTAAQKARVAELEARQKELTAKNSKLNEAYSEAGAGLGEEEQRAARAAVLKEQSKTRQKISAELKEVRDELEPLTPGQKRQSFVWLYENLGSGAAPPSQPGGQR